MQSATATPSRAESQALVAEKRISRMSIRLGDTLRARLEEKAHACGSSLSNYVLHYLASEFDDQPEVGETLADDFISLERTLQMSGADLEDATALQRLWLIRRLARITMMLAGGK